MSDGEIVAYHRTIVVADVAEFTHPARSQLHRQAVHQGIHLLLQKAMVEAGVAWDSCKVEDRGDGAMVLVPPDVPKILLADQLPGRLLAGLRRHNAVHAQEAAIQLRVGFHAGEVIDDGHGIVSDAVNFAFRILDAQHAKSALKESGGVLALIASPLFFQDVVLPDPAAEPHDYLEIPVSVKGTETRAWLRVPGAPNPWRPIIASAARDEVQHYRVRRYQLPGHQLPGHQLPGHQLSGDLIQPDQIPHQQIPGHQIQRDQVPGGQEGYLPELVEALANVPVLADPAGRRQLLAGLTEQLGESLQVRVHPTARRHLHEIVRACLGQPKALRALVAVLEQVAPDSSEVRRVRIVVDEMPTAPYTRLAGARLADIVDTLLEIPTVREHDGRQLLLRMLPAEIGTAVRYHPSDRLHVIELVRTCDYYPGGMNELVEALRGLERDSYAMRRLEALTSMV